MRCSIAWLTHVSAHPCRHSHFTCTVLLLRAVVLLPGGAFIKYGSLLIDTPFQPSPLLAVSVVLGTPMAYSIYFLTQGQQQQQR